METRHTKSVKFCVEFLGSSGEVAGETSLRYSTVDVLRDAIGEFGNDIDIVGLESMMLLGGLSLEAQIDKTNMKRRWNNEVACAGHELDAQFHRAFDLSSTLWQANARLVPAHEEL